MIPEELYRKICSLMPIPCVDLLVTDTHGRVLLVKRKNPPAADRWWFPGGRVHLGEARTSAAARKLREECGLTADILEEIATYDVFLQYETDGLSHGITTLFRIEVGSTQVQLDKQSNASAWRLPHEWAALDLDPFVAEGLKVLSATPRNDY
jgi:8-oxo-dGTP diphosphatase